MSKIIGKVSDEERLAIWEINCHKTSLEELLMILSKDHELYEQAHSDYQSTLKKYQEWWDSTYTKYQWEKGSGNWKIVFSTNEIIIE